MSSVFDWLAKQRASMSRDGTAQFTADISDYYDALPKDDQPEGWGFEREERRAIQEESRVAFRDRRIFSRVLS